MPDEWLFRVIIISREGIHNFLLAICFFPYPLGESQNKKSTHCKPLPSYEDPPEWAFYA